MKNFILISLVSLSISSCNFNTKEIPSEAKVAIEMPIVKHSSLAGEENKTLALLNIEGMSCEVGCAKFIQSKLSKLDGVNNASINFEEKIATVDFDKSKISEEKLFNTITELKNGTYKVTAIEIQEISASNTSGSSENTEKITTKQLKPIVFPDVLGLFKKFLLP